MENKVLIAERVIGKGDTWILVQEIVSPGNEKEYNSLTECLEAYYQKTKYKIDYVLSPLKGELYALLEDNKQPPIKKFSLYDE
jgi:hypothetical protein